MVFGIYFDTSGAYSAIIDLFHLEPERADLGKKI